MCQKLLKYVLKYAVKNDQISSHWYKNVVFKFYEKINVTLNTKSKFISTENFPYYTLNLSKKM